MFKVLNFVFSKEPELESDQLLVHPFYKEGFCRLNNISEDEYSQEHSDQYPDYNRRFLVPILRKAADGYTNDIVRFYDIRTTEEYCHPAPEYLLMHDIGIKWVDPLGVKGMGLLAFPFGLQLADSMAAGERALICCADLPVPLNQMQNRTKERTACAFIVEKCDDNDRTPGVYITEFQDGLSQSQIEDYAETYNFSSNLQTGCLQEVLEEINKCMKTDSPFELFIGLHEKQMCGYLHFCRIM